MLPGRSLVSAASESSISTVGILSHLLLRRSDYTEDQKIKECSEKRSRNDCEALCAKNIQAIKQLQADITECEETCDSNINIDECKSTCIIKVTGVSEEDHAKMNKVKDSTKACPNTDSYLSNMCVAMALGVSKNLIVTRYDCVDQNCISVPDKQYVKCIFRCTQPIIKASSTIKDDDTTTNKHGKEADIKVSGAFRHHSSSPTVVLVVTSMALASLILNLIAFV